MLVLLDFTNNASNAEISTYLTENGCAVVKQWNNYEKTYLVEVSTNPPKTNIVERIIEESAVTIRPHLNSNWCTHKDPSKPIINVTVGNTQDWWKNYSTAQPVFDGTSTTISRLGSNITVYLMDSGIEITHPEFINSKIINLYSVTPNDFSDRVGHGTALASVIVGNTCGITNATLKVVKITDPTHTTLLSELLDSLDAIITDHVDNTFSVLNCSFAIDKNEWVEHKLRLLAAEGVFIMAAAGNDGRTIEDVTPASMMEAMTIGAYNQSLYPCDFSNFTGGSTISVAGENSVNHGELDGWAPGENIYAASLNGTYGFVAGTSIATAITSAVLASNLSWLVDENGQKLTGYHLIEINALNPGSRIYMMSRQNILDLQDPKYKDSVNLIATLLDRNSLTVNQAIDEHTQVFTAGEGKINSRVYEPTLTKAIDFIDALPENFHILPDGRIYGHPSLAQGPNTTNGYNKYICTFNRTNLNDEVEKVTVTIYITDKNLEPESLPSDDPVRVRLLDSVDCNVQAGCTLLPSPVDCGANLCFSSCCAEAYQKNLVTCTCV